MAGRIVAPAWRQVVLELVPGGHPQQADAESRRRSRTINRSILTVVPRTAFASLTAIAALSIALVATPARAASDVRIAYGALQRLVAEQAFSTEGRRYVKGSAATRCSFAYLEHPLIDAQDGRLRVRARFSGRSALNLLGACAGMGDSFDVVITARPEYRDGSVVLTDVRVEAATHGFYATRVCRSLAESLPTQVAYPILREARRTIEAPVGGAYPRKLTRFEVRQITIRPDALVLSVDLEITVG
jgi:hypothetical protein